VELAFVSQAVVTEMSWLRMLQKCPILHWNDLVPKRRVTKQLLPVNILNVDENCTLTIDKQN